MSLNEKMRLFNIHKKLKIKGESLMEELPEQLMAIKYLTGNEKVLEIGGNIGRNSLVIGTILNKDENLVVLESNKYIVPQLNYNKNINNMNFHVEGSALSKRKLIQRSWFTFTSDEILPPPKKGPKWVSEFHEANIITFEELEKKYNIIFDTLVLDCEGAFYYILKDAPEILKNIKLIIIENDYRKKEHKEYVDGILKKNSFNMDYTEKLDPSVRADPPCKDNFYEVWKK